MGAAQSGAVVVPVVSREMAPLTASKELSGLADDDGALDPAGQGAVGEPRSVLLSVGAAAEAPASATAENETSAIPAETVAPASGDDGVSHLIASTGAAGEPRALLDGAPGQATLEDRGVGGAFLSFRSTGTEAMVELPLPFASIERDDSSLRIKVHAAVHPGCAYKDVTVSLRCSSSAEASSWHRDIALADEEANGRHWGVSKSFMREQRERWMEERKRCDGMTVAEYFNELGHGEVFNATWGWCEGVLKELEAKAEKSAKDVKEIAYYRRKVEQTEPYEEMELTDYMNVLKLEDLVPADQKVAYADFIRTKSDSSGRRMVGAATVFVSHVWKMTAKDFFEVCLAEMAEDDYAWIDLYLHNQYQGAVSTIGDENSMYWINKFGELIGGIGKVIAIVTDWESPVMLTRIWCLFELNAAIDTDAELRFVATAAERLDLSVGLQEKFEQLEVILGSIDVRECDAKRPHEIQDKEIFLSKLQGQEGSVNDKLRRKMREWLTHTAGAVLTRTDPWRSGLDAEAMALEVSAIGESAARKTALLERWPRLPTLLAVVGLLTFDAVAVLVFLEISYGISLNSEGTQATASGDTCVWALDGVCDEDAASTHCVCGTDASDCVGQFTDCPISSSDGSSDGSEARNSTGTAYVPGDDNGSYIVGGLGVSGIICLLAGSNLEEHQKKRQLRQPPAFGQWATRNQRALLAPWAMTWMVAVPAAAWVHHVIADKSTEQTIGLAVTNTFLVLAMGFYIVMTVRMPLKMAAEAAEKRAELAVMRAWLLLRLGEAKQAVDVFRKAHTDLQTSVGVEDPASSWWWVAPGYTRALWDAGQIDEAQALVVAVKSKRDKYAAGFSKNLSLLSCVSSLGYKWHQIGAILSARMAAAIRRPDAEVLALLAEAGETKTGKRLLLDANKPEFGEFLSRMTSGDGVAAADLEVWQALPPVMRSAGDNPLSEWVKIIHEGKHFYSNRKLISGEIVKQPAQHRDGSLGLRRRVGRCCTRGSDKTRSSVSEVASSRLTAPPKADLGCKQILEVGMHGLDMTADEWQSMYFDLKGAGCWTEQRNRRYKLITHARKIGKRLLLVGLCAVLFSWMFIYTDCVRGDAGIGSCANCRDGFTGKRCSLPPTPSGWTLKPDTYCNTGCTNQACSDALLRELTLIEATAQCASLPDCVAVADGQCDGAYQARGGAYSFCTAMTESAQGSCVYTPDDRP
jgi:hypothetical protein